MPAYIAKKVVYYMDRRFKDKAYSRQTIKRHKRMGCIPIPFITEIAEKTTGFIPPSTRKELENELLGLPSAQKKTAQQRMPETRPVIRAPAPITAEETAGEFNPIDYLESYDSIEDFAAPLQSELEDGEAPPLVIPFDVRSFSKEENRG
jgi:hypothetical protein